MMKTSIETIGGRLCTVIRKPFDAEWVKSQLDIKSIITVSTHAGLWPLLSYEYNEHGEMYEYLTSNGISHDYIYEHSIIDVVTILPAIPLHPTPQQVAAYAAQDITPMVTAYGREYYVEPERGKLMLNGVEEGQYSTFENMPEAKITHATDKQGNRVEVAINGAESCPLKHLTT